MRSFWRIFFVHNERFFSVWQKNFPLQLSFVETKAIHSFSRKKMARRMWKNAWFVKKSAYQLLSNSHKQTSHTEEKSNLCIIGGGEKTWNREKNRDFFYGKISSGSLLSKWKFSGFFPLSNPIYFFCVRIFGPFQPPFWAKFRPGKRIWFCGFWSGWARKNRVHLRARHIWPFCTVF